MSRVLMGVYEQLEAGGEGRGITTLPVGADPACRTQVFTQTLSWSWCQQTHLDMDLYDLRRCQAEYHPDCEAVTTMMQRNRFFKVVSWLCWESAFSCQWIFFFKINYQKVSVQYFFKNQTNDNKSSTKFKCWWCWIVLRRWEMLKVVFSYMEMHGQVY